MKFNRKVLLISISLSVAIAGTTVPAFAADINDVYNDLHYIRQNQVPDVQQIRAILYSQLPSINTDLTNIYNRVNTYLPSINDIKSSCTSIDTKLTTTNSNLASVIQAVNSQNTYLSNIQSYTSTSASNTTNILSGLSATLPDIHDSVVQLQEVLASDEDLAIRQGQQTRVDQINDDFLDTSGDASVSLGDLGAAKDSVSNIKSALSGGASSSTLWNVLNSNSNAWDWFSQATADDLDSTGSRTRTSYSYLNDYYSEVSRSLGNNYYD